MASSDMGCGGWVGMIIIIAILWNVGSCVIGTVWDGAQEVIAERNAKQEIANEKARERLDREAKEKSKAAVALEKKRQEEAARREKAEREKIAAEREVIKADKLRSFAMKDAPGIWRAYQQLNAAIDEQDTRIKDLAATLREFDKVPEKDADYLAICATRNEMSVSLKDIRRKLEEAYLAYCRFKATPSHKEYSDLMKKALEDGSQAAESAARKFDQMRMNK